CTVHDAHDAIFWLSYERIAPLHGQMRVVLLVEWVNTGVFIANDNTIRDAVAVALEAYLPVDVVAADEGEANACITRMRHDGAHLRRPVLVVAKGDKGAMRIERIWTQVEINVAH